MFRLFKPCIYEYRKEHGIVPDRAVVQHFATDTVMIKKEMSFKQISDLLKYPWHNYSC
jgi:membrane-bound lytic murein transglycosylase D